MTYITKEDWNQEFIPKLLDDKAFLTELIQIVKIHNILIRLIGLIIKNEKKPLNMLKQNILYSSMIYYNKYILYNKKSHSEISYENKIIICSSCIFLSLKVRDIRLPLDYISKTILSCIDSNSNKIKYSTDDINNYIIEIEYNILYCNGFNFEIDNPYAFWKPLIFYFEKKGTEKKITEGIMELFNRNLKTSILFPLYLYYTSYEIAIGSLSLVKKAKYEFIDIDDFIKENKLKIDKNNAEQCSLYINKISENLKKKSDEEENNNKNDSIGEPFSIFDVIASINTNTNINKYHTIFN